MMTVVRPVRVKEILQEEECSKTTTTTIQFNNGTMDSSGEVCLIKTKTNASEWKETTGEWESSLFA